MGRTFLHKDSAGKTVFLLRWLLLPLLIAAVFVWSYYSTEFLAKRGLLRRWIEPVAYFQCCFLGALLAGWCIPRWKTISISLMTLILIPPGLQVAAWFDPITHEPTVLPFASGTTGGFIGLVIVAFLEYGRKPRALDP